MERYIEIRSVDGSGIVRSELFVYLPHLSDTNSWP
jgi:hypothetical protein